MNLYPENPGPYRGPPVDFYAIPATRRYLDHFANYLILDAMLKAPKNAAEKRETVGQIARCEKKLAWFKRHPNFDVAEAARGVAKLKAPWAKR